MSEWKSLTPYWQFKRPETRKGEIRHREHRTIRLDQPEGHEARSEEDRPTMAELDPEAKAAHYRFLVTLDRCVLPALGCIVSLIVALMAWLVFAPFATPDVPRPDGGYPVQLLDPSWPGATLRDGRRASYANDAPDDNSPEPPLHLHDHGLEGRPR